MKIITLAALVLITATHAQAADWRVHLSKCNQNVACAKEQAKAQALWTGQGWDADLKESCREHVSQSYNRDRDYVAAVNCVYPLQIARQEYIAKQAQIERDRAEAERARAEAKYYKRGGTKVIIPD